MTTCGKDQQVEELVATYNNNLTMCLDKHAPWRRVCTRNNIPHPWYDADIADARERRRKIDNLWRRTKLEVHRQLYVNSRDECYALTIQRKMGYFQERLEIADNKSMFRIRLKSIKCNFPNSIQRRKVVMHFHVTSRRRLRSCLIVCIATLP